MNKTKIALAVAAASMISFPAFATNGDNLMGLGVQSRALGGTGTAAFYGSENSLSNPSLLAKSEGTEFAFGGIYFTPDVSAKNPLGSASSDSDTFVIPEISLSTKMNDKWTFGLGMYGVAGLGVDYRKTDMDASTDGTADALFEAFTSLQLMKFAPSFSYDGGNYGFGFAPTLMYGALSINFDADPFDSSPYDNVGSGVSTDLGFGYNLGAHYDVNDALTVGFSYQSETAMKYDGQLTDAADVFGVGPSGLGRVTSDKLNQPAETAVGVAYKVNSNWMVTADAKTIAWSAAKGYGDAFEWDDQTVFGVGAKYSADKYWVGFGYNQANNPIPKLKGDASTGDMQINVFNHHFFPGIIETHYTLGGGYQVGKNVVVEGAYTLSPEVSETVDATSFMGGDYTVDHSQSSLSFSVRMNF